MPTIPRHFEVWGTLKYCRVRKLGSCSFTCIFILWPRLSLLEVLWEGKRGWVITQFPETLATWHSQNHRYDKNNEKKKNNPTAMIFLKIIGFYWGIVRLKSKKLHYWHKYSEKYSRKTISESNISNFPRSWSSRTILLIQLLQWSINRWEYS